MTDRSLDAMVTATVERWRDQVMALPDAWGPEHRMQEYDEEDEATRDEQLVERAGRDADWAEAAKMIAARQLLRGESLSKCLAEYVAVALLIPNHSSNPPSRRKPVRDVMVWVMVGWARNEFGLKATRSLSSNPEPESVSACAVVAEALQQMGRQAGGEENINRIWKAQCKEHERILSMSPDSP